MEIEYRSTKALIDIRMKQIEQISLESFYFNEEYRNLEAIRQALAKLIILERNDSKDYDSKFEDTEVKGESKGAGNE